MNNPPAFPADVAFGQEYIQTGPNTAKYPGMTLLDAAALKTLPVVLTWVQYDEENERVYGDEFNTAVARKCYDIAQAMLTERERRGGDDDA